MDANKVKIRIMQGFAALFMICLVIAVIQDQQTDAPPPTREEQIAKHFSPWDGSNPEMVKAAKEMLTDPNSFEHIETRYFDMDSVINISMVFTATNMFGGREKIAVFGKITNDGQLTEFKFVE